LKNEKQLSSIEDPLITQIIDDELKKLLRNQND